MNAKQLALVIAFAALAIALNAIRIPAFFWPGVRIGVFVGFLNL